MIFAAVPALALLFAVVADAQTNPAYQGELLVQPGNHNGKCMTVASNSDGAIVTLQTCNGAAEQKWTFGDGTIKAFGNKCLDVTDGSTADGTKLQVWTCSSGNTNQRFTYSFWDMTLKWTNTNMCLDLTDGSTADGNRPQIWTCGSENPNQVWNTGYMYNALPSTSEVGQSGTNNCGSGSSQSSKCQTAIINSAEDFCLWAPPEPNSVIGDTERVAVAWCTKSGRGTRVIPDGTLQGVHFVKTPDYVQITGVGDFTKTNIAAGDQGGELDPHGADGNGNPIGGLVYGDSFGTKQQYHEWTSFISSGEFCFRACNGGPNARKLCQHIYDVMGCYWNMPANYDAGVFENCEGDNAQPMGIYGTSTWFQGVNPTPAAHPAPASSNCAALPTVGVTNLRKKRNFMNYEVERAAEPEPTGERIRIVA